MPKAATAAGTGAPVSGDHSNAMEIAQPVEDNFLESVVEDPKDLGSHRSEGEEVDSQAVDDTVAEAEIPVRLRGKSPAQIIKEFAGLEREYSRQGNELGEARSLMREILKTSLNQPGAKPATDDVPDPTEEEFDSDPRAATRKLIEKETKPLRQAVATAEQRAAIVEFNAKHPGFQAEAMSPEFQEWVGGTPYRTRMFEAAAKFDLEAAEDLFAMWDQHKASAGDQPTEAERRKTAIKQTVTETGGAGKTVSSRSGKKIYKAAELARLFINDRERYNEMGDEIRLAYAEGRVR